MIYRHIEEKASLLLKSRGFFEVGFDIEGLTTALNIQTERRVFDDNVSGVLIVQGETAIISYHKHEDPKRQRFTIAHEIGHFVLHSKKQPLFIDKVQRVMYRNNTSSTGDMVLEREANAFAAALLMPSELLKQEIENKPLEERDDIRYLAQRFKVSEQAMSYRLANLNYYLGE